MDLNDISALRLVNQQIIGSQFKTAKEILSWMGAVQAQDFSMAKWAIGLRLPGSTNKAIEKAFSDGDMIRTHVLRPTWHFVSPDDISWMLELTSPRLKASMKSRHKQLGLTDAILSKSRKIIEKSLANENFITRNELKTEFEKAKIATDGNRLSHLMMHAELERLVCSGPVKGKQQTYALFDQRVPKKEKFIRDEALAKLAQRYFMSHCPATFRDFVWWSGLTVAAARQALEMVKPAFISEKIGEQTYWLTDAFSFPKQIEKSVYLMPAFDEFIISYKDRSASLIFKEFEKKVSYFGVFRPLIVENGKVTGIWKRAVKKDKVLIATTFFRKPEKSTLNLVEKAIKSFGNFLEMETVVSHGTV